MIQHSRPARAVSLALLVTFALSGCSTPRGGTATPISTVAPVSTSPSAGNAGDFGDLKACDLLNKALQGKGFSPGEISTYGGPNGCSSEKSLYASTSLGLQVGAPYDKLDFDADKQHRGEVHDRRAIQIRNGVGGTGACAIALEVGPTSRAFVSATMATGTTDEACSFVTSIAENIEPMLPKVR